MDRVERLKRHNRKRFRRYLEHGDEEQKAEVATVESSGKQPPQPYARINGVKAYYDGRNRIVHQTESQTYWHGYHEQRPETPAAQSSAKYPDQHSASTNTVTPYHEAVHTTEAQPYWNQYQNTAQLQYNTYRTWLNYLEAQLHGLASTYRNFGFLYFSFPAGFTFNRRISPDIEKFTRYNFVLHPRRQLPDMCHLIGTIGYALCTAATALKSSGVDAEAMKWAQCNLQLAYRCVLEAMELLWLLQQALEVFCGMRTFSWMEGTFDFEGRKKAARRMRLCREWAAALPLVCWQGSGSLF